MDTCWGYDESGWSTPPSGRFDSISAGGLHTCGVREDGFVACWRVDEDGEATPPAARFTSVGAGYAHTCGVKVDGSVTCWGYDDRGHATPPHPKGTEVVTSPRLWAKLRSAQRWQRSSTQQAVQIGRTMKAG